MINARKFHGMATGAVQRVFSKSHVKGVPPFEKRFSKPFHRFGDLPDEIGVRCASFGIKAIVTKHMEMLFRDMDDQFFDEFGGAFSNGDLFIVLMALVAVGDIGAVISGDAGLGHDGPSDVADDVMNDSVSGAKVGRRSIDVETVIFGFVEFVGEGFEVRKREGVRVKGGFHVGKQGGHEPTSEHGVREEAYGLPFVIAVKGAFGDDHMYMWIPFEVTPKGMESANHAGFEFSGMILFIKPVGNGLGG